MKEFFDCLLKKNQLSKMGSKLELSLLPCDKKDENYKTMEKLYEGKQDFMYTQMGSVDSQSIETLLSQSVDFPLIKASMQKLGDSYQLWDSKSPDEIKDLKQKIELQHKNLIVLSGMLKELGDKSESSLNALREISLPSSSDETSYTFDKFGQRVKNDTTYKYKETAEYKEGIGRSLSLDKEMGKSLEPYINGDEDLAKVAETIKEKLAERIQEQEKAPPRSSLKPPPSPISKTAIFKEAEVFKVAREGKIWAAMQSKLEPLGTSAHSVFQLKNVESKETLGYFKQGDYDDEAAGKMETLMWDLAVIMGLEAQFAPTKTIELQTGGGSKTGKILTKEGDLVESKNLSKAKFGGVQAEIKGKSLLEYIFSFRGKTVSQKQIAKATATSLAFGMFDAHIQNIRSDDEGNLFFFDNTRSMPHSNGVVYWAQHLFPSYRSGLLGLSGSYEPLSDENRKEMTNEIERMQAKLAQAKDFFNLESTKKRVEELPPLWLNIEQSLGAMEERLANMKNAIPKVKNLRDFVFEVIPDYKFFAAMHMLIANKQVNGWLTESLLQRLSLQLVGATDINELLTKTCSLGIDPKQLRTWCQDPSLSFEDIMSMMWKESKEGSLYPSNQREKNAKELYKEYKQKAKIDLKDCSRASCKIIERQIKNAQLTESA